MQSKIINYILILSSIYIANGQLDFKYEIEFLEPGVYSPCADYPDNFVDTLFDLSNVHVEQTDEGSILVKGPSISKVNVEAPQPLLVEVFKKERGTWQQTVYTTKRADTCTACFDPKEVWHSYLKNTPKEQQTCPFLEGQTVDFDINEPTFVTVPIRNGEGEYNFHVEVGNKTGDFFICVEIFAMLHKVN